MNELRFCWWNVCDYAEFVSDVEKRPERGPESEAEYDEKTRRLVAAFDAMYGPDVPELVSVCELTPAAARRLQVSRFPDHDLILSAADRPKQYQIAMFSRRGVPLVPKLQFVADGVPRTTRPMLVIDFAHPAFELRFVFCHWTAFDEPQSAEYRGRLADALRVGLHAFLHPNPAAPGSRHAVVVGDLNAEPFDPLFEAKLSARRYRRHATQRDHWTDRDVRRVRLYNCGWRFLGERSSHGVPSPAPSAAGTYFRHADGSPQASGWHTFDHVLVTGGLLGDRPPFLDESRLSVRSDAGNLVEGEPRKFAPSAGGSATGLSDHLPLTGVLVLA